MAAVGAADNIIISGVQRVIGIRVLRYTALHKPVSFQVCSTDARGEISLKNGLMKALSPHAPSSISMDLFVADCLGQIAYAAHSEKTISLVQANARFEDPLVSDVVAVAYSVLSALSHDIRQKQKGRLKNLLRYGVALVDDEKTGLFRLAPSTGGAVSIAVAPGGTAAAAGLQTDDSVIEMNGNALVGSTQAQLNRLVAGTDTLTLKVRRATTSLTIKFQAENLSWYRHHLPGSRV
ncbi:MAG: PDZ domain-containing protein [Chloroflexota bacterium]|nr:PDZ domain-containing protein [Chloroflexota bacterium]